MCQKTDGYGNWNVRQVQCLSLDRPAPSLHSSVTVKWQVGCRMSACNQHARASCLLQEPLINSQTSKTQKPNSKSGSTSGDWSDLLLHGFSLNGVWFLSLGHSLQKLPMYIYFPPPCVCCLSSWPQLESAVMDTWTLGCPELGVPGTVPAHSSSPWSSCVTSAFPDCRTACVVLVFVALCIPEGLFCSFSARVTLVVAEAIGKCGWAGVFLCVGHWVKSSEQCLLSNGTFRWDELLVIRLIWGLLYAKPFPAPSLLYL